MPQFGGNVGVAQGDVVAEVAGHWLGAEAVLVPLLLLRQDEQATIVTELRFGPWGEQDQPVPSPFLLQVAFERHHLLQLFRIFLGVEIQVGGSNGKREGHHHIPHTGENVAPMHAPVRVLRKDVADLPHFVHVQTEAEEGPDGEDGLGHDTHEQAPLGRPSDAAEGPGQFPAAPEGSSERTGAGEDPAVLRPWGPARLTDPEVEPVLDRSGQRSLKACHQYPDSANDDLYVGHVESLKPADWVNEMVRVLLGRLAVRPARTVGAIL
mmetsp:Transcript_52571/g.93817  ORF Transcript_52571/g.93817 Transcript_52571/m.93817 type:complete len:266 (+) Transcript_52571:241-1038(+)